MVINEIVFYNVAATVLLMALTVVGIWINLPVTAVGRSYNRWLCGVVRSWLRKRGKDDYSDDGGFATIVMAVSMFLLMVTMLILVGISSLVIGNVEKKSSVLQNNGFEYASSIDDLVRFNSSFSIGDDVYVEMDEAMKLNVGDESIKVKFIRCIVKDQDNFIWLVKVDGIEYSYEGDIGVLVRDKDESKYEALLSDIISGGV